MRVSISFADASVSRDGRTFHATSGPSAVTWQEPDGAHAGTFAIDRTNGDLYHWRGTRIVEGGRCTGAIPF